MCVWVLWIPLFQSDCNWWVTCWVNRRIREGTDQSVPRHRFCASIDRSVCPRRPWQGGAGAFACQLFCLQRLGNSFDLDGRDSLGGGMQHREEMRHFDIGIGEADVALGSFRRSQDLALRINHREPRDTVDALGRSQAAGQSFGAFILLGVVSVHGVLYG